MKTNSRTAGVLPSATTTHYRTLCQACNLGFISGVVLLGALSGCTTYVEHSRPVVYEEPAHVTGPAPVTATVEVVIRAESDFYQPLSPHGRWEVIGTYGRCWIPNRVDANWRPYCNGHWERTDAGWYWDSDE